LLKAVSDWRWLIIGIGSSSASRQRLRREDKPLAIQ
jgi:hypothetical protein